MAERMVTFINTTNRTVGVKIKEYGINKVWKTKNQKISIPYTLVEEMLWHEGFRAMIDRGILYIENLQDKIDLGLEPEGAKKPENILVVNDEEIRDLLIAKPITQFKDFVDKLNPTQITNIVNYAIANDLVDVAKSSYLQEKTGIDILKNVARKKEMERIDLAEAKAKEK